MVDNLSKGDQGIVTIRLQKQNKLLNMIKLFVLLPAFTYFIVAGSPKRTNYWLDVAVLIVLWMLIVAGAIKHLSYKIRGKNIDDEHTLKLTPEGFYRGDTLYRWHDIDFFGIKKEYRTLFSERQVIYWNFRPASTSGQSKRKGFRFLAGYDGALSLEYEIEPHKLVELLNGWKTRYSGQRSEIKTGGGLSRKVSTKEVVIIIAFTILLIIAFGVITAVFRGR